MSGEHHKTLICFDFDYSLVNDNSDTFIFANIPGMLEELYQEIETMSWTNLMDKYIVKLQLEQGVSIEGIKSRISEISYFPEMVEICKTKDNERLYILSDANDIYIEAFLERHQINENVSQVFTNGAPIEQMQVDGSIASVMRIRPYVEKTEAGAHNCSICSKNMCKGEILRQIIKKEGGHAKVRIVYIGDGRNDFCPGKVLSPDDLLCVRSKIKSRVSGLSKQIQKYPEEIRAKIAYWEDGSDCLNHVNKFRS